MVNDRFDIRMLYTTKPGGQQIFVNDEGTNLEDATGTNGIDIIDDSVVGRCFRFREAKVRAHLDTASKYNGTSPIETDHAKLDLNKGGRGYMYQRDDWRDVESTAYWRINNTADDGVTMTVRGGQDSDQSPCEGSSYQVQMHFTSGLLRIRKQRYTAGYVSMPWVASGSASLEHWVGLKLICANRVLNGKHCVQIEVWTDANNNNQWIMRQQLLDAGSELCVPGTGCGTSDNCQIINWGGPWATFRTDTLGVNIARASVREISYGAQSIMPSGSDAATTIGSFTTSTFGGEVQAATEFATPALTEAGVMMRYPRIGNALGFSFSSSTSGRSQFVANLPSCFVNIEVTGYMFIHGVNNNGEEVSIKLRGGRHTDSDPDEGSCYIIGIGYDGSVNSQYEEPHPNNHSMPFNTVTSRPLGSSCVGKWFGIKAIVFKDPTANRDRIECWIDRRGLVNGVPQNDWVLFWQTTSTEFTGRCNGLRAYFRMDDVSGNEEDAVDLRLATARNISVSGGPVPPGPAPGPGPSPPPPPPPVRTLRRIPIDNISANSEATPAANAVDGLTATFWSSTSGIVPALLICDLGGTHEVERIGIDWQRLGVSRGYNFSIQTSTDGLAYSIRLTRTSALSAQNEFYDITPIRCQYVRISVTGDTLNQTVARIDEIQLQGDASTDPGSDPIDVDPPKTGQRLFVAPNRIVASTDDGNIASRAYDGFSSTYWASRAGMPQWIWFDFGGVRTINAVRIWWLRTTDRQYTYYIETSQDNVIYTRAFQGFSLLDAAQEFESSIFSRGGARFVRIVVTDESSTLRTTGIREVEIWGEPGPEEPPPPTPNPNPSFIYKSQRHVYHINFSTGDSCEPGFVEPGLGPPIEDDGTPDTE